MFHSLANLFHVIDLQEDETFFMPSKCNGMYICNTV